MSAFITEISAPTIITEGTRIQGDLTFQSNTQIHGLVEGDVHQQSLETLTIGRTGWVKGCVNAEGPILVEGRVEGDIVSALEIRLSTTACVHGTVTAPQVDVRPGAIFEGEFHMKSALKSRTHTTKRAA